MSSLGAIATIVERLLHRSAYAAANHAQVVVTTGMQGARAAAGCGVNLTTTATDGLTAQAREIAGLTVALVDQANATSRMQIRRKSGESEV